MINLLKKKKNFQHPEMTWTHLDEVILQIGIADIAVEWNYSEAEQWES